MSTFSSTVSRATGLSAMTRFVSRPVLSPEALLAVACLFFAAVYCLPFWRAALAATSGGWLDLLAMAVVLWGLHFLVLLPLANRVTVKPVIAVLCLIGAAAGFYSWYYGTYYDVSMLTNVFETDYLESRELITGRFLVFVALLGLLPGLLFMTVVIPARSWRQAVSRRLIYGAATLAILIISLLVSYQSVSTLMRNHKELRYLVAPGNVLVSAGRAIAGKYKTSELHRQPIGEDATFVAGGDSGKPLFLVVVVGETQRAGNWSLDGYARDTNPRLGHRSDIINFPNVTSCGTSTAVSVPCMFSDVGRDQFSDAYARGHESLLDLVARSGIDVEWVDNQSGCKGVCDNVETERLGVDLFGDTCKPGRCMDAILIKDLELELDEHRGNQLLVLHQMGSHGPAYYLRYPKSMEQFSPTCDTEDLSSCTREQVVNSYDNSVLYTDYVLDRLVDLLKRAGDRDTALIYVSDHGESLGEMGVYLHGLPYMIAPSEQTHVPMVWWLSDGFEQDRGIDGNCLRAGAGRAYSHDNLFHTIIGMMGIQTSDYDPALDISAACRWGDGGKSARLVAE